MHICFCRQTSDRRMNTKLEKNDGGKGKVILFEWASETRAIRLPQSRTQTQTELNWQQKSNDIHWILVSFTAHRWHCDKANFFLPTPKWAHLNLYLRSTQCMKIGFHGGLVMHIDFNFQSYSTQTFNTSIKSTSYYYPDYCHWLTWFNTEFAVFRRLRATAPCLLSHKRPILIHNLFVLSVFFF